MRWPWQRSKPAIGLDIGSSLIKAVELNKTSKGHSLVNFGIKPLLPEVIVDGEIMDREYVIETIRELFDESGIQNKYVVTTVSGRAVIAKKITMDKMSEQEARESIRWEAEQHVPFDIEDVYIDLQILDDQSSDRQMDVLLVAAKKEDVDSRVDLIREAGLSPVIIDFDNFTLLNSYEMNYGTSEETVAIIDVGSEVSNLVIVRNGMWVLHRENQVAGKTFIEAIQRNLNLTYDQAASVLRGESVGEVDEAELTPTMESVFEDLSSLIDRAFSFVRSTDQTNVDKILVCGGNSRISGLVEYLGQQHAVPVEKLNPLRNVDYDISLFKGEDPDYIAPILTVGIGLALRKAS